MRIVIAIFLLFPLFGCIDRISSFKIEDPHNQVEAAQLDLCGDMIEMNKGQSFFHTSQTVDCEGPSRFFLYLRNGVIRTCTIGYVAPSMEQAIHFSYNGNHCELLDISAL